MLFVERRLEDEGCSLGIKRLRSFDRRSEPRE